MQKENYEMSPRGSCPASELCHRRFDDDEKGFVSADTHGGPHDVAINDAIGRDQQTTAERLMRIAERTILTNTASMRYLPPVWTTLYYLSKMDDDWIEAKIKDGTIHPRLTQRHI